MLPTGPRGTQPWEDARTRVPAAALPSVSPRAGGFGALDAAQLKEKLT